MAHEIETKILGVDTAKLEARLEALGAKQIQKIRLVVDWFRTKNSQEGQDPWFLRIRSYSDGKVEVTWKGKSDVLGVSRKHKEINFTVSDASAAKDLFEQIGMEQYAHQEKDRISWNLKDWQLDLDQYPGMPAYLEIEGPSEESIKEAIEVLDLKAFKTSSEGERLLIQNEYNLDWYNMQF
jgi:adenylate cyclase class 2